MYNIGIIMGGVMPVPAVCDGEETYYKNFVKTVYEIIEENAIGGQQ